MTISVIYCIGHYNGLVDVNALSVIYCIGHYNGLVDVNALLPGNILLMMSA